MRAAQVLDYQKALRDGLRTGFYRTYLDGFLKSVTIKSGTVSRQQDLDHLGDEWADTEIRTLEAACAFHVDREMAPLIRHAAAGLDEDFTWSKEVFPSDRGFMMFDEPLTLREVRQRTMRTAAVVWRWGSGPYGQAGVWLSMYSKWDDALDEVAVEIRERLGDSRCQSLGPLHINHVQFVPWGHNLGPANVAMDPSVAAAYAVAGDPVAAGTQSDNPLRDIYATLALMGQTVTTISDEDITPPVARRMGKKRIPPRVVVIRLRRSAGSRQPGETMVEWAHRWVVRGHWRKQPCGPNYSEIKVIYIAPFIKGPEGKPLIISEKVYDLRR